MRRKERKALDEALKKLDALVAASLDEESSCAVFKPWHGEWTVEQKRIIRAYVTSWIQEPLLALRDALDGERGYANESYLDSL